MSSPEHKPLFNRRYLYWLMWIVAIAIVLLQTVNRETSVPLQAGYSAEHQAFWIESPSQEAVHTHLLLMTGPRLTEQDHYRQALLQAGIERHLAQPNLRATLEAADWQASLITAADHLRLELISPRLPSTDALTQLISQLQQPVELDLPALRERIRAERYIEQQQPLARLLNEALYLLAGQPDGHEMLEPYEQVMTALNWQVTLSGTALGLDQAIAPTGQTHPWPASRSHASGQTVSLQGYQQAHQQLLLWPLPAPDSAASLALQRLAADLLSQWLQQPLPGQPEFRLLWSPMSPGGYVALQLSHRSAATLLTPDGVQQHLSTLLTDDLLQQSRQRFRAEAQRWFENPRDQQRWLDLLVRYQLPPDSHAVYLQTLEQVTTAELLATLSQLLAPDHAIHIMLQPY